jgi:Flp pilus assembly protein TadD
MVETSRSEVSLIFRRVWPGFVLALAACATPQEVPQPTSPAVSAPAQGPAALLAAGDAARAGGDPKAVELYRRAAEAAPGDATPLTRLGAALVDRKSWVEAEEAYTLALSIAPDDPEARRGLGEALLLQSKADAALTHLEAARAARPTDPRVAEQLGLAYDQLGDFARARAVYEAGLRAASRHLGLRTRLGLSLAAAGQFPAAIETLSDVTTDPAATAEHRRNLAMVLAIAGERDRAISAVRGDMGDARAREAVANWISMRSLDASRRLAGILGVQRTAAAVVAAAPLPEAKAEPVAETPAAPRLGKGTSGPALAAAMKPPADPVRSRWVVRAGAFSVESNARQHLATLKSAGFDFEVSWSGSLYIVQSAPQPNFKAAADLARRVQAKQSEARVVPLPPTDARG